MDSREELYQTCFQMIVEAGDARMEAEAAAESYAQGQFQEADGHLREAEEKMTRAYEIQTGLLQMGASGGLPQVDLIVVHAEDHLCMANMAMKSAGLTAMLARRLYGPEKGWKEEETMRGV